MLGTLDEEKKPDWKSYVAPLVHSYNATRHESTGYSPHFVMFGWHPRLAIDAFLGVISDSSVKDHITYVSSLEKRLKFAYKTAAKVAEKASKRHKTRYDLRVRHSNLQKGDRVLLKKVGFKGKHKLENKWERDPYIIESQPDTDIPVYVLTPEHRRSRKVTVHRNMLLPILSLPTKEIGREHTPPKPKRSKENDSSEHSTQEMEKETVDEGHMDEPNDVRISSDDDDEVYACSNKHGTHKPSRISLILWPPNFGFHPLNRH